MIVVAFGLCVLIVVVVVFQRTAATAQSLWMRLSFTLLGCSGAASMSLFLFNVGRGTAMLLGIVAMALAAAAFYCLYRAKSGTG